MMVAVGLTLNGMLVQLAHVGLVVAAQAVLATGWHRGAALAWGGGLAVAAAVFALGPVLGAGEPLARVEWSFAAGSAAGWVLAMVLLLRAARRDGARA